MKFYFALKELGAMKKNFLDSVRTAIAGLVVLMIVLSLIGCSNHLNNEDNLTQPQNSPPSNSSKSPEQTTTLLGTYFIEISESTRTDDENTFFEFLSDGTFFLYSGNYVGAGIYNSDGNIVSLTNSTNNQLIAQLTISTDYQTVAFTDGTGKFIKDSRPHFQEKVLSGIYVENRDDYGTVANPDGTINNKSDGRYYEFFEDYTYKEVYPNWKDASSTGTYTIQGDILKMNPSNNPGNYLFYLISLDGNSLKGNHELMEK